MGREEKRLRERSTKQLTKRLRRKPTEEEITKEIEGQRLAPGLALRLGREGPLPAAAKRGQRPR